MSEIRLAAIFSDGLVFQRNQAIKVFGSAADGMLVVATIEGTILGTDEKQISGGEAQAKDGRFEITLPPLKEGIGHVLKVSEKNSDENIVRKDIAIGEVWIAGGQSNMEFELGNCDEKEILNEPGDADIRFYYTLKTGEITPEFEALEHKTHWEKFGEEGTTHWSAVATFFARKLKSTVNVPIGIIGCNLGGTSASGWMPVEALETKAYQPAEDLSKAITDNYDDLSVYLRLYDKETEGRDEQKQREDYKAYLKKAEEFDRQYQVLLKENPNTTWDDAIRILGPNGWPGPMGVTNPYSPGVLFECMVKRIAPYQTKGVLFYQGESDEHLPHLYERLFTKMIACWREVFQNSELPFVHVLLPAHRYEFEEIGNQWCLIREAQRNVAKNVPNTYVTNMIDQGVFNDIHPTAKKVVGERMCDVALASVYHLLDQEKAYGPVLVDVGQNENQMILTFSKLSEGLFVGKEKATQIKRYESKNKDGTNGMDHSLERDDPEIIGFEIAGEDQVYHVAQADYTDGKIRLWAEDVTNPKYARYHWQGYMDTFLYDKDNLPMFPFRTSFDDGFEVSYNVDLVKRIKETGSRI